jgi:hypothetical protein
MYKQEVFNEIIGHYQDEMITRRQDTGLSALCKLQVVRSVAVANGTTHGDGWHSATELLLRHVVECFDMVGAKIDPQEISSVPIFLSDLSKLSSTEQQLVLSTVLLAQLLDGRISKEEIDTWQRIFLAVGMEVRKTASYFEFSLCLSRACLGKMIVFIYKWLKNAVFRSGRKKEERRWWLWVWRFVIGSLSRRGCCGAR